MFILNVLIKNVKMEYLKDWWTTLKWCFPKSNVFVSPNSNPSVTKPTQLNLRHFKSPFLHYNRTSSLNTIISLSPFLCLHLYHTISLSVSLSLSVSVNLSSSVYLSLFIRLFLYAWPCTYVNFFLSFSLCLSVNISLNLNPHKTSRLDRWLFSASVR
jgi:hypothetical protein